MLLDKEVSLKQHTDLSVNLKSCSEAMHKSRSLLQTSCAEQASEQALQSWLPLQKTALLLHFRMQLKLRCAVAAGSQLRAAFDQHHKIMHNCKGVLKTNRCLELEVQLDAYDVVDATDIRHFEAA